LIWQATEYCIGKQEYFNFQFLAVFFFKLPYTYRSIWLFEQDQMGLAPGLTAIYGWTGEWKDSFRCSGNIALPCRNKFNSSELSLHDAGSW
jgi:hypothetical protein